MHPLWIPGDEPDASNGYTLRDVVLMLSLCAATSFFFLLLFVFYKVILE